MNVEDLKLLWVRALNDLLEEELDDDIINVLALQTLDSIRRVDIYRIYRLKAEKADETGLSYQHTSNPFVLSQRTSLDINSRVWYVYLATYFGKSNRSKWTLFNRASYRANGTLITLEEILENREDYFSYLETINLFDGTRFSNHRKYTKKELHGNKGLIQSINYFLDHIDEFSNDDNIEYDIIYKRALNIPNFGRMAAFDFTSSLCKCNLHVNEPTSMYHENSTGPLSALKDLLRLAGKVNSKANQIELGNNLLTWFRGNSEIFMVAQVLEDAICNWQKSHRTYQRYFG